MYLKNIIIENNGPIARLELFEKDLFKDNGEPNILIFTGKNGSGKTILLSNITDSFFEFANQNFNDILPNQGYGGHSYYRVVGDSNQKIGTDYSFSFLNFEGNYKEIIDNVLENGLVEKKEEEIIKKYEYLEKTGRLTFDEIKGKTNNFLTINQNWEKGKITSNVKSDKKIKDDFFNNTYCFFPVSRFEKPHWLNDWKHENREKIKISNKYDGDLNKPIIIENSLEDNKSWILDIFLDFLVETEKNQNGSFDSKDNLEIKNKLKQSKINIEKILSKILQKDLKNEYGSYIKDENGDNISGIEIKLNLRNNGLSRLRLIDKVTNIDLIPSLDNLSGGQSILLNMFSSIIRLSDMGGDLNKSINLNKIEGIVLIDEIDLSLHIDLQKEVLPELLALFPRVQFIITSHSPFFLLGIEEKTKKDSNFQYQIIKMPEGKIENDIKGLEEVDKAYGIFEENFKDFKKEFEKLNKKLEQNNKTLIITEGKTDWKHLENALKKFKEIGLYGNTDIEFLKYEDEMGDNVLLNYCIAESKKIERINKIICIFDRDKDDFVKKACDNILGYKNWGNKFYSFCIPKVLNRDFENICIEHYYTDEEIKTLDINNRRLFLGTEFHKNGNSIDGKYQTDEKNKCEKNSIIENNIFESKDLMHSKNIALSKNDFVEYIKNGENGFNSFNLDNFKLIFDIIEKIENPTL